MTYQTWNWMLEKWPHFSYDKEALQALEFQFSQSSGKVLGVFKYLKDSSQENLLVEILSEEAMKTSEIEGELLNRDSVQSSIKRNLGLTTDRKKVPPAEYGISEMMVDLFHQFDKPLTHEHLFEWHKMVCNGRRDIKDIGCYRTHEGPMQVVSGAWGREKIHYEAPPSDSMPAEMNKFVSWFNSVHHESSTMLPLAKAGISHLHFVCVHPFEDGNGRIGRAIAEKSLALSIKQPTLIALSYSIEANKKAYYGMLEKSNTTLDITEWLLFFGHTILDAQEETMKRVDFLMKKTKFFDGFTQQLNERQLKVLQRLFDAGHKGFDGGLSADNYKKIAKTTASSATRDLQDLIAKDILVQTGKLKGTRYWLNVGKS